MTTTIQERVMEPSDTQLTGTPQSIVIDPNTGLPQNVIIIQQPSSGPKIIGILIIIWGVFGILGEVINLGNTLEYGGLFVVIALVNLLVAGGYIAGGYMIQNYQKKGIHLSLLLLVVSTIVSVAMMSLMPGMIDDLIEEDNDLTDDDKEQLEASTGLIAGIGIVFIVICNGICGLIIAIPMMISNNGLDDSKLFG